MKRLFLLLLATLMVVQIVFASRPPSGMINGTAGAGISNIRGAEARFVNPALLALRGGPYQSIQLPGFVYHIGNNAIKTSELANWFQQDRYWTASERKTFTDAMSDDFRFAADVGTGAAYQYRNFVVALDAVGAMNGEIPQQVMVLALSGNKPGVSYDLSNLKGGGWAGTALNLSFGKSFEEMDFAKEFAVGLTVKYIIGHAYGGIRKSTGSILTNVQPDTVSLHGDIVSAYSTSGDGIDLDLGVASRQDDNWGWSLSIMNLSGRVNWDKAKVRSNSFNVDSKGIPVDSLTKEGFFERWANYKSGTNSENGTVDMRLPPYLLIGADYRLNKDWLFVGSIEQGLDDEATMVGGSKKMKLALGSEYGKFEKYPIRGGFSFGGSTSFEIQLGAGLRLPSYRLDLSGGYERGIFGSAKGFSIALSHSVLL